MRRAADSASASLIGLAWRFHIASRACAKASSAQSRVSAAGQLSAQRRIDEGALGVAERLIEASA